VPLEFVKQGTGHYVQLPVCFSFLYEDCTVASCHGLTADAEDLLNTILEFKTYLKENTTLHHYKYQLVNAV
jgi:hypothetical protein